MQTGSPHFFNLILACQFAHEMRTLSDTPKDMCTGKSRHMRSRQQYFMVASKRRTVRGLGPFAVGVHESAYHRIFVGDTCQLCPSYGCWHHVRGLVSSIGHFGGSLGRRQFGCGPPSFLRMWKRWELLFLGCKLILATSVSRHGWAHS